MNLRTTTSLTLRLLNPRRASGRRGITVMIALFVMLAITGMGLVALNTATQEIKTAGNHRLDKQAERISASAMTVTLGEVGAMGDAYWQYVKMRNQNAKSADGSLTPATMDKSYTFDTASFTGKLLINPGGDATNLNASISVVMDQPTDGFSAPGFSENFCFKRFSFDSTSTVGTAGVNLDESRQRFATASHRAWALLGPMDCEGN